MRLPDLCGCLQRRIAASNVQCGTRACLERELIDDRDMIPLADIRERFRSHCMEIIQARDKLIQYEADIYGHDVVKKKTISKFYCPTYNVSNSRFWRV